MKISDEKVLECAEMIKNYCKGRDNCDGCIFKDGDTYIYFSCKINVDIPENWNLEINEE